jgi:putative tryptophan/tyrosine transport system substrate-binding protein
LVQMRADALVIGPDNLFNSNNEQLGALTLRYKVPAVHQYKKFAAAGGLVSYGASETEPYLLFGIQVGKILNGAKPAELPVQQSTKIELIINPKTAKALDITIPQSILARADEVIE